MAELDEALCYITQYQGSYDLEKQKIVRILTALVSQIEFFKTENSDLQRLRDMLREAVNG